MQYGGGANILPLLATCLQGQPSCDADYELADKIQQYWVDFAHHGDPNGGGGQLPEWPEYSPLDPKLVRAVVLALRCLCCLRCLH